MNLESQEEEYTKPNKPLYFCSCCCGCGCKNFCCSRKRVQGDLFVTAMNMGAALLHFLLAVGMVLTLSYWKSDDAFDDDVMLGQLLNFIAIVTGIFATVQAILVITYDNPKPDERDNGCDKCVRAFSTRDRTRAIIIVAVGAISALTAIGGFITTIPYIDGTFPVVITLAPNTADPVFPYNDTVCNGTDYKDESVFDWTTCIRDTENIRTIQIFDVVTGKRKDWENDAGLGCDVIVCTDIKSNGYSSNEACQKCGGGQECKGRTCYIQDNPNSFIQVQGVSSDASSFIQVGVPEVIIPYKENKTINTEQEIKKYDSTAETWSTVTEADLQSGDTIRFFVEGRDKGPKETGTYVGDGKAEGQRGWYNWWFLWAFSVFTCAMHTWLAISGWFETDPEYSTTVDRNAEGQFQWGYLYTLEKGAQPYRWFEYSITASVMFFIVLQLNRVTDLWINIAAVLITTSYNVFAAGIELTENAWYIAWFWWVSWLGFVVQFAVLFYNTEKTIQPYFDEDLPTRDLWAQLFSFVAVINVTIFVAFLTFPVLHVVHLIFRLRKLNWDDTEKDNDRDRNCMYRSEIGYIILSFAAKGLLVFLVFWGVAARND